MTTQNDKPIFHFENPPVSEVVCGVLFKPVAGFTVSHFGQLWEKFKSDGYDTCQDTSPIFPAIEQFDPGSSNEPSFSTDGLLPRVWFIHRDGTGIVQVQRDRFLHNWKKAHPDDAYPHYHQVKERFSARLLAFTDFLSENQLGSIEPLQYEVTYVNHILHGEGLENLEDIGKIFTDLSWRATPGRFLPGPSGSNLGLQFDLPDRAGRLHVTIRSGLRNRDRKPVLIFELTVRGMPSDRSTDAMWRWFDVAREWIVNGFVDLTDQEVQKTRWGRT